jgi:GDP-mannose 6-dehydrogenase
MIGLSFKSGTDDLRESPLVMLAEHFLGKGMSVMIYDSEVHLSRLLGANRRFIEQHLPHVGSLIRSEIGAVIDDSDVLVVGQNEPQTIARLIELARTDQTVIDLVRLPGRERLRAHYEGLCWQ